MASYPHVKMKTIDQSTGTIPAVKTPPFVSRYVKVRRMQEEVEAERRQLEAIIIDWGKNQILEGNAHGMSLPLSGVLRERVELSLFERKPNENQLLESNLELRQLKEEIEEDKAIATEKNATAINALIKQMEDLSKQIHQLYYSEVGHQLLEEYDAKLALARRTTPPITGVKLKYI